MSFFKDLRIGAIIMFVAMAVTSVTSCNDDDDTKETVLHQNYVQGKLNNHDIAINDINENIPMDKSDYDFSSGNQTDIPTMFDWDVTLIETKDSIIELHLHINDVERTNEIIYSPNDEDPIKTKSTCYATVKDLKSNTTSIYHPIHTDPINVAWKIFMITINENYKKPTKHYNYQIDYIGHKWHGIEGNLYGTLTCDDPSKTPLKINIKFLLY